MTTMTNTTPQQPPQSSSRRCRSSNSSSSSCRRRRRHSSSSISSSILAVAAVATSMIMAAIMLLLLSTPPATIVVAEASSAAVSLPSSLSSSLLSGWFNNNNNNNGRFLQDEDEGADSDSGEKEDSSSSSSSSSSGLQSVDQPSAPIVATTPPNIVIHPVGTELWYEDPETGLWDQGTISGYSATKGYYITWSSDGSTQQYTNTTLVDGMVENNNSNSYNGGDLSDYEPWEIGSFVLSFFDFDDGKAEGSGFYGGTITDFTRQVVDTTNTTTSASYTITWSDGEVATYDDLRLVDVMIQSYENYEPWIVGTKVALSQNGISWMKGSIVSFDEVGPPVYKIQWEADASGPSAATQSLQTYHNLDLVDQHVQDYLDNQDVLDPNPTDDGIVSNFEDEEDSDADGDDSDYVPYPKDTPVHYLFDGEGYDGTIVHFHVDTKEYEVLWEDDETSYYGTDQYELVDEMVTLAKYTDDDNLVFDDDSLEAEYDIGTIVYSDFDGEWWVGEIISFDAGWYTVRYTDGSYVDYSYNGSIHELVVNAEDIPSDEESQMYPVGTRVVKEFSDGFYEGSITNYAELTYTIVWSDGQTDYYVNGEELDSIVTQGKLMPSLGGDDSQRGGMSKIGKLLVSVLVILSVAFGLLFFQKRIKAVLSKSLSSNVASRTRARLLGKKKKDEKPIFIRKSSAESSLPEPAEASIATGEESISTSESPSVAETDAEQTTSTDEEEQGTTASTASDNNDDAEQPTKDLPSVV